MSQIHPTLDVLDYGLLANIFDKLPCTIRLRIISLENKQWLIKPVDPIKDKGTQKIGDNFTLSLDENNNF